MTTPARNAPSSHLEKGVGPAPRTCSPVRALRFWAVLLVVSACGGEDAGSLAEGGDAVTGGAVEAEGAPVLALFPFENQSPNPTHAYFAAGFRQELMNRLAGLEGIRVISPRSPDLEVGYGVNGAVRREGANMTVEASLSRLSSGETLWAGEFTGTRDDFFQVQAQLVEALATAVGRSLTEAEVATAGRVTTTSTQAHDLYLHGHDLGHRGEASDHAGREAAWREAIPLFQQAAELDPSFVGAWTGLALHHLRMYWYGYDRTPDRIQMARLPLEQATSLDPNAPEVLVTRGYWYYWGHLDYLQAVESYRAAQELKPGDVQLSTFTAYVLRRQGEMEEAARILGANSDLDPTDAGLALEAGDTWHSLLQWDTARRYLERARAGAPGHPSAWLSLGYLALAEDGDVETARELFQEGALQAGADNFLFALWRLAMLEGRFDEALAVADGAKARGLNAFILPIILFPVDQMAGFALLEAGREDEARRRFQATIPYLDRVAPEYGDDHRIHRAWALNHAALGNLSEAVDAADRGVTARSLEVDAFVGGDPLKDRAWVLTLTGHHAEALKNLERIVNAPTLVPLTPALLRLDPRWDPLRDDPRFQALLENQEP